MFKRQRAWGCLCSSLRRVEWYQCLPSAFPNGARPLYPPGTSRLAGHSSKGLRAAWTLTAARAEPPPGGTDPLGLTALPLAIGTGVVLPSIAIGASNSVRGAVWAVGGLGPWRLPRYVPAIPYSSRRDGGSRVPRSMIAPVASGALACGADCALGLGRGV